jgi:hypothetical protein
MVFKLVATQCETETVTESPKVRQTRSEVMFQVTEIVRFLRT